MGKIVQFRQFVNSSQDTINGFLSQFPAEDIISTHYFVRGDGDISDEFVGIFYKTIDPKTVHPLTESELEKGKILDDIGLRYATLRFPNETNEDYAARLLTRIPPK